jgi:hypothetical protein
MPASAYEVIDNPAEKVAERNQAYYAKFPEDVQKVKKIMQYLTTNKVPLPSGWLTPARFQQLGIMFGFHGKDHNPSIHICVGF